MTYFEMFALIVCVAVIAEDVNTILEETSRKYAKSRAAVVARISATGIASICTGLALIAFASGV